MNTLTKQILISAAILVGAYFAQEAGHFAVVFAADKSGFIVPLILIGLTFGMGYGCLLAREIDLAEGEYQKEKKVLKEVGTIRFLSELAFDFGLASTILGFIMMFMGMGDTPGALIESIKQGLSVAVVPTGIGIVANVLLRVQVYTLEYSLKIDE